MLDILHNNDDDDDDDDDDEEDGGGGRENLRVNIYLKQQAMIG
jgi:hypothetical protein